MTKERAVNLLQKCIEYIDELIRNDFDEKGEIYAGDESHGILTCILGFTDTELDEIVIGPDPTGDEFEKSDNAFQDFICERNDFVDNKVYQLILDLLGKNENELEWDMGIIGDVTDAITAALEMHGLHFCHPYHEGDNEAPCYKGCDCPINCKFKEVQNEI